MEQKRTFPVSVASFFFDGIEQKCTLKNLRIIREFSQCTLAEFAPYPRIFSMYTVLVHIPSLLTFSFVSYILLAQAVSSPAVRRVRASGDYLLSRDNWRLGLSALLAGSLGLAPFKNVFWSNQRNPGNKLFYHFL